MFIIGGGGRNNNPFAKSAGITIGKKPEPVPATIPMFEIGRPAASVSDEATYVEPEPAPLEVCDPVSQVRAFVHEYPFFGGSDVALTFEPYDSYTVTDRQVVNGKQVVTETTYQKMAASLPRTVPFEGIDDRIWLRAVYTTDSCHTQRIEVRLGDEILGLLCMFARYNWSIYVARPGLRDGMPLYESGAKTRGWVFDRRAAGVARENILDPLEPWYVLPDMLRYLKTHRPELGLK